MKIVTDSVGTRTEVDIALADQTYCGDTEPGTAGATLAFGNLVYFSVTDSRWELTDADASATSGPVKIGMCVLAAAADGSATRILTKGRIRADSLFPTGTVGAPAYASLTAGEITVTKVSATDDVSRILGYWETADELDFCPSNEFVIQV